MAARSSGLKRLFTAATTCAFRRRPHRIPSELGKCLNLGPPSRATADLGRGQSSNPLTLENRFGFNLLKGKRPEGL